MPSPAPILLAGPEIVPNPVWDLLRQDYLRRLQVTFEQPTDRPELTGLLAGEPVSASAITPGLALNEPVWLLTSATQQRVTQAGFPVYGLLEQVTTVGGRDFTARRGTFVEAIAIGQLSVTLDTPDLAVSGDVLIVLGPSAAYAVMLVLSDGYAQRTVNPEDAFPEVLPAGTVVWPLGQTLLALNTAAPAGTVSLVCFARPDHTMTPGEFVFNPGGPNEEVVTASLVPVPASYRNPAAVQLAAPLQYGHAPGELLVERSRTTVRAAQQLFLNIQAWDAAGHVQAAALPAGTYDLLFPRRYTLGDLYGQVLLQQSAYLRAATAAAQEEGVSDPAQLLIASGAAAALTGDGVVTVQHNRHLRGYTVALTPVWGASVASAGALGLRSTGSNDFQFAFSGAGAQAGFRWTMLAISPIFAPLVATGVATFDPAGVRINHGGSLVDRFFCLIPLDGQALAATGAYGVDEVDDAGFRVRISGVGGGTFRWLAFNGSGPQTPIRALGTATFGGDAGVTVTHGRGLANYDVLLLPLWDAELPGVGDYGLELETLTPDTFKIRNTGANTTSQFIWAVLA